MTRRCPPSVSTTGSPVASTQRQAGAGVRLRPLLLALALLGSVLVWNLQARAADDPAPERVVIVGEESPPFEFTGSDGRPRGIIVDIWHLWGEKLGIEVDYRIMTWTEALEQVQAGEADIVAGMFRTDAREPLWDFSRPYYAYDAAIFFHEDLGGIRGIEDLKDFRVGLLEGDAATSLLEEKVPDAETVTYPTWQALVGAALKHDIGVFLADVPQARHYLAKLGGGDHLRQTSEPVRTGRLHGGVREGNAAMVALMNKGFSAISEDEIAAITERWAGLPSAQRIPWTRIGIGAAVLLAALLAVHIGMLRHQVRARTRALKASEEKLLQTNRFIEGVLDAIADPINVITTDYELVHCNAAAREVLRREDFDLDCTHCFEVIGQSDPCEDCPVCEALATGRPASVERYAETRGRWYEIRAYPYMEENGTVRRVIEHARDITDQRKACEALRQSKESLEEEVRQRTEELIRSERLSAVGTLASGVAHEFNNINVTVLGFAELGTELPNLPADARDFFERIQSAGRRAKRITQNMLSFTRHASPVPQAADLRQTIRGALDLMRHEFATTGVEVVERLDPTPSSTMEPDLIAQVALNLLINAQHAMHGADRRVLTVRCGKEGDRLCFSVEDTGCGMNEETRRQIFSPFFTTKGEKAPDGSPMGSLRGTGLGLSVCHTIVRNHDGEIRCDSAPGRGTTFTVALPFHPPSTPDDTSAQASASAAPAPKGRVLALDDEPEVCELVSMALGGVDLQIECFQDPEAALDHCCAQAVDVLLLDLQMPRMNGWEVARRLRATGGTHQPRILILTGRTAAVAEEDLIRCGIDGVVTKPFEVRELRDRIDACLQRR